MNNSTRRSRPRHHQKAKPYASFPLTAHVTKRWCKKIKGRIFFFGPIVPNDSGSSAQAALDKYLFEKNYRESGRTPPPEAKDALTLRDLANAFLTHKRTLLDNSELTTRTFGECHRTCDDIIKQFGRHRRIDDLRQGDFAEYRVALSKRLGPVSLGNTIQRTRSLFKFAIESGMLLTPVLFGPGFKRPTKKTLRLERAKKGPKLFARDDIIKLIEVAGVQLKAMILLACNAGLGAGDLSAMPLAVVNLTTGWVDYARPKTGIPRRFVLWPETLEAVRNSIAKRPTPKDPANAGLLFITKYGGPWCNSVFEPSDDPAIKNRIINDNAIPKEFAKLFLKAGIERTKGHLFYALRHVFETVAGDSRDQIAVDHVMGHSKDDMASVYRERISDARLQAVASHVRTWLFSTQATEGGVA